MILSVLPGLILQKPPHLSHSQPLRGRGQTASDPKRPVRAVRAGHRVRASKASTKLSGGWAPEICSVLRMLQWPWPDGFQMALFHGFLGDAKRCTQETKELCDLFE